MRCVCVYVYRHESKHPKSLAFVMVVVVVSIFWAMVTSGTRRQVTFHLAHGWQPYPPILQTPTTSVQSSTIQSYVLCLRLRSLGLSVAWMIAFWRCLCCCCCCWWCSVLQHISERVLQQRQQLLRRVRLHGVRIRERLCGGTGELKPLSGSGRWRGVVRRREVQKPDSVRLRFAGGE